MPFAQICATQGEVSIWIGRWAYTAHSNFYMLVHCLLSRKFDLVIPQLVWKFLAFDSINQVWGDLMILVFLCLQTGTGIKCCQTLPEHPLLESPEHAMSRADTPEVSAEVLRNSTLKSGTWHHWKGGDLSIASWTSVRFLYNNDIM